MKPILVDAIYIKMGGALMILNHLIDNLVARNVSFVLLKDNRCPKLRSEDNIEHIVVKPTGEFERIKYYIANRNSFSTVICLGNVPPAIRMPVKVHTYIHNVSLLKIPKDYPVKWKVLGYMKRMFIRLLSHNSDSWIVQTDNTLNLVKEYLPLKNKDLKIFPFYHIPSNIRPSDEIQRDDYVFIGEYTHAKGHEYLIEAWSKLADKGFCKTLHLTVTEPKICVLIKNAQANGASIINHGRIPFEEVVGIYHHSSAIVYPSLNESLGLGIIEAAEAGCDVIGCDLPYLHSVCCPSETFKPCDSDSIVEAILKYESGNSSFTKIKVKDKVDAFIDYLK